MNASRASLDWPLGLAGCLTVLGLLTLLPSPALPVALAALIAVVGMPHGGLDHLVGRAVMRPVAGRCWLPVFLAGYLAVMAAVLAGWWLAPLPTLLGFVLLSALHFGMADDRPESIGRAALACLRGGMVVWVPALVRPAEFSQLLGWVVPGERWADLLAVPVTRWIFVLALVGVIISALASSATERLRSMAFLSLYAAAPALVSFAAYFCGWHSVIEISRLARQAGSRDGLGRVIVAAAPLSAAAVLLGLAGWWCLGSNGGPKAGIIRAVFVGLSVVAVPHMLLHLVAERWDVNPFESEVTR